MNKFVIIPKEQYDKFKETQNVEGVKPTNRNLNFENKSENNLLDENFKDKITQQVNSEDDLHKTLIEEKSPPPGLPYQKPNVTATTGANGRDTEQG